jgi:multiple sugar transport system ATP-binding protein
MRDGMLQQVDEPERLYAHPRNLFVAAFIGSPSMNLLEGKLDIDGDSASVVLGDQRLTLPPSVLVDRPALKEHAGKDLVIGMRPEHLTDPDPGSGVEHLTARVELREALGSELLLHLRTNIQPAVTEATKVVAADVDEEAVAALQRQASAGEAMIVARFDTRSHARVGDTVEVAVDAERMHFFDPETGDAIWS